MTRTRSGSNEGFYYNVSGKPSTLAPAKAMLRQRMRAARELLPPADRAARSAAIADRLTALPGVGAAGSVFVYLSVAPEVDTRELVRRWLEDGRRLAVPRLDGPGVMRSVALDAPAALRPGTWGIPTPPASAPVVDDIAVAVVPGLAFDAGGGRLGHGAGYYDRWLAAHPGVLRIGVCYESQLVPEVPCAAHDVPMHLLVTEQRLVRTGADPQAG